MGVRSGSGAGSMCERRLQCQLRVRAGAAVTVGMSSGSGTGRGCERGSCWQRVQEAAVLPDCPSGVGEALGEALRGDWGREPLLAPTDGTSDQGWHQPPYLNAFSPNIFFILKPYANSKCKFYGQTLNVALNAFCSDFSSLIQK